MRDTESLVAQPATRLPRPVVIGHRGAPAYRPEHTAASYELAIDLGAELIEPDVVISRDGVLVVRHESELSLSTDVADREAFADRRTTRTVKGKEVTGWFTEDFTLTELRTLRAVVTSSQREICVTTGMHLCWSTRCVSDRAQHVPSSSSTSHPIDVLWDPCTRPSRWPCRP